MGGHIATGPLLICGAFLIFKWLFCQYRDESIVVRQLMSLHRTKKEKKSIKKKKGKMKEGGKYESQKKT